MKCRYTKYIIYKEIQFGNFKTKVLSLAGGTQSLESMTGDLNKGQEN